MILYYVHDPMCSWCWAFGPTLKRLLDALPDSLQTRRLLGGLAADSDQPMPAAMREQIAATWQRIEASVPGSRFNHSFWQRDDPRRSTFPACRAVLLASRAGLDGAMTGAIQRAYYLEARNPSNDDTLIELAADIGLDRERFAAELNAPATQLALEQEIAQARALGVNSYPTLVLDTGEQRWPIAIDYNDASAMLETIAALSAD